MSYPSTGHEVYVSFSLSNTMFSGVGKSTITREEVSADYLKALFAKHGVIVSAKPEHRRFLEMLNETYDLKLDIPEKQRIFQLSEKNRRVVIVNIQGVRRENGSLLGNYSEDELNEATFSFIKYYIQSRHFDELVAENEALRKELETEIAWHNRDCEI